MSDILKPRDAKEVEQAVHWAFTHEKTLEVLGQSSKRLIGRPIETDKMLDLSAISGITLYEPAELVLSARAGTPLSQIETLLNENDQELAFEPMDYSLILNQPVERGTLGGTIAANLSGPRRIKVGAARDHFLGVTAVTGRGEIIKSGGRVVKNVTGYDLCKVLAGSWGTLAVMTDVTMKVMPKAETEATVLIAGLSDAEACKAMGDAMGSPFDVSGAAHVPDHVASSFEALPEQKAGTVLRLEGFAPSVRHRKEALAGQMKCFGPVALIEEKESRALWRDIRAVRPFTTEASRHRPLWRVSTAPAISYRLADLITSAAQMFYDWAGGLVWITMPFESEPEAAAIRTAVAKVGGHATLIRAAESIRAVTDIFERESFGILALNKRVKESFDPQRILNPGRMWPGV
jgi:glycolate dehydrogenase FAD-binding subunit